MIAEPTKFKNLFLVNTTKLELLDIENQLASENNLILERKEKIKLPKKTRYYIFNKKSRNFISSVYILTGQNGEHYLLYEYKDQIYYFEYDKGTHRITKTSLVVNMKPKDIFELVLLPENQNNNDIGGEYELK